MTVCDGDGVSDATVFAVCVGAEGVSSTVMTVCDGDGLFSFTITPAW